MSEEALGAEALEAGARVPGRRDFFRAVGAAAAVGGGLALAARPAASQTTAPVDADFLNFALQLEYLEAQFFHQASFGTGLPASLTGGKGEAGEATGGRAVAFTDQQLARYVREIAEDERNHVEYLRVLIGASAVVAQPRIDISRGANGPFSTAARAAGLIGEGEIFDPYASDGNFLLAAFLIEDVIVSAYGRLPALVTGQGSQEAIAGLAAAEGHHSALIRTSIYRRLPQMPELGQATVALSNYRDSLDGAEDLDQGVTVSDGASNIAPLDSGGRTHRRSPAQVLNVLFQSRAKVRRGGFFPAGLNGKVIESEDQTDDE